MQYLSSSIMKAELINYREHLKQLPADEPANYAGHLQVKTTQFLKEIAGFDFEEQAYLSEGQIQIEGHQLMSNASLYWFIDDVLNDWNTNVWSYYNYTQRMLAA